MSEKQWYEDVPRDEIQNKHVRVACEEGATFDGRLQPDGPYAALGFEPFAGLKVGSSAYFEGFHVLERGSDDSWHPLIGIASVDLVWDERDWDWIGLDNIDAIDALVVSGRLYELVSHKPDCDLWQVHVTGEKHMASVSTSMISWALRRKVKVPVKPGFYKDGLGEYWARVVKPTGDRPWRAVEPDALDQPARSDKYMANLMPLTPVHFVEGRAPAGGDKLGTVMRMSSKGVTFTTEAA